MSGSVEIELFKILHGNRQKYTYFLLAAVGASIGFAVTQTKDAQLTYQMIPLGIAAACWAISFYFGCRCPHKRSVTIGENIVFIKTRSGTHPMAGKNPQKIAIGLEIIRNDFKATNKQVGFAYRWQFRMFMLASLAFLVWHVLEMWQRTSMT